MTTRQTKVREFAERFHRGLSISELRKTHDRDEAWCQVVASHGGVVFSVAVDADASKTNQKKVYFSSDEELAHFILTNSLSGLKMQLETEIAVNNFQQVVTKLLVSEEQWKQAPALRFFCQLGERYVGFEGEVSLETLSAYNCQPCLQQPAF